MRVVAGLIHQNGEWLIAQRGKGRKLEGFWEFPGGKIQPGESEFAALIREIDEELGLKILPERIFGEFTHDYEFGQITLVAVVAKAETKEVRLTEHEAVRWCKWRDIEGYKLSPADIPVWKAGKPTIGGT